MAKRKLNSETGSAGRRLAVILLAVVAVAIALADATLAAGLFSTSPGQGNGTEIRPAPVTPTANPRTGEFVLASGAAAPCETSRWPELADQPILNKGGEARCEDKV